MKMNAIIVLLAVLVAPSAAASVRASSVATAWLKNHAGSPDQLAELRGVNPEAYALVNALLTKRSLGLLKMNKPTASMTDTAPATEVVERGPEAFAKLAAPTSRLAAFHVSTPKLELPYANVKATHHDWLNWKPHSTSADATMVQNAMSMVGGLSGARASHETSAPIDAPADVADHQPSAPVDAPAPKATSGWGAIGSMLGLHKKVQPQATRPVDSEEAIAFHPAELSQTVAQKPNNDDWSAMEKSKQSSDGKAVSSLLKMVAQLKGGKAAEKLLSKHHIASSESSALSNDLAAWGDAPEEVQLRAPVLAPAIVPSALAEAEASTPTVASSSSSSSEKENSWGSIGGMMGVHKKPHHRMHMSAPTETASTAASSSPYGLNWKPKAAGADAAMVANVLGMVGMKGAADAPAATVAAAVPEEVVAQPETPMRSAPDERRGSEDKDEKAVSSLLKMVAQLKGGKAAAKLLSRRHHVDAEETADATVFSAPAATPTTEASAPKENSWGSIGGMWGVHHKAAPIEAARPQAAVEEFRAGAMPAEVQALVSDSVHVHRAAKQLRQKDDYTSAMKQKQNADGTAVNSLLRMVAQLKGGRAAEKLLSKHHVAAEEDQQTQGNSLTNDMDIFGAGAAAAEAPTEEVPVEAAPAARVEEVPVAPATPTRKKNLFLDSLTSSLGAPEEAHHHVAALAKENSYLKEFDLMGDSKRTDKSAFKVSSAFASAASNKLIASWFSDDKEEKPKIPVIPYKKGSKLLSWLDTEQPEPTQAAVVTAKAAPVNPYIADLS